MASSETVVAVSSMKAGVDAEQTRPGHELVSSSTPCTSLSDIKILIVATSLFLLLICALSINLTIRWVIRRFATSHLHADSPPPPHHYPGLTKRHLTSLPTLTFSIAPLADPQSQTDTSSHCPICLVDFEDGDRIRVLPKCHHVFHVKCVDTWLRKHSSCPTCRGDIMDAMSAEAPSSQVEVQIVIAQGQGGALCSSICKEDTLIHYFC